MTHEYDPDVDEVGRLMNRLAQNSVLRRSTGNPLVRDYFALLGLVRNMNNPEVDFMLDFDNYRDEDEEDDFRPY